ncbi:MAG: dihydropteridine reductase [Clostridia bacterium]|nr:dihydropteridine reductase [Clostridia bacterium]
MTNTQKEIAKIKADYTVNEKKETKLEKLKKLDKQVKRPVQVFSYALGTVGALVLGTGMTMAMSLIPGGMAAGIIIGSAGIAASGANYPLHQKLMNKRKKKYSEQIIEMSDSILNENNTQTNN